MSESLPRIQELCMAWLVAAVSTSGCFLLSWDPPAGSGGTGGSNGGGGAAPTTSSSSPSSTTSTASSATSSSTGQQEDCADGEDNDNNGLTDCADPACQGLGFACVDVPSGWSGPAALYDGPPGGLPACGGTYAITKLTATSGFQFGQAVCAQCACSPLDVSCDFSKDWNAYGDAACNSNPPNPWSFSGAACGPVSGGAGIKAFKAAIVVPKVNTSCVPSGGEATLPAPAWSNGSIVCGEPKVGAGCASMTAVCAPPPPPGFLASTCIWRAGDQACPAPFLEKHALYNAGAQVTDSRGCTPCTCALPSPLSCSLTVGFYSDANCTTIVASVPSDGTCVPSSGDPHSAKSTSYTPPSSTCAPGGGMPNGTVIADVSWTACCLP